MKIILDAMSGDNAPLEIIKGAIEAAEEYPADIILTGDDTVIRSIANDNALGHRPSEYKHSAVVSGYKYGGSGAQRNTREERFFDGSRP